MLSKMASVQAQIAAVLCLVCCAIVLTKAEVVCTEDWVASEVSHSCVQVIMEDLSWNDSRDACLAKGGDLVKILNETMNNLIYDLAIASEGNLFAWIGLNDVVQNGTYVWSVDGSEADWFNWHSASPRGEDCVAIYTEGTWLDLECDTTDDAAFVCEVYQEVPLNCATGWEVSEESSSCVQVTKEDLSWYDSREVCIAEGGDLVKILNENMNNVVYDLTRNAGALYAWIGLNDLGQSGTYVWSVDESEPEWDNWSSSADRDENCVGIYKDGVWLDFECESSFEAAYVCEVFPEE